MNPPREHTRALIEAARAQFGHEYRGFLSNHLPMALLALEGIGADEAGVQAFHDQYIEQLDPLDEASGFAQRMRAIEAEIAEDGVEAVLADRLPPLMSGWYRAAFHPVIRIAYGYDAGIPGEVAAGLAYQELCGDDAVLKSLAEGLADERAGSAADMFQALTTWGVESDPTVPFGFRAAKALRDPRCADLRVHPDKLLAEATEVAFDIFAATHNFFALHLVTGSHAFRTLYRFAGEHRDTVLTLGLAAGFLAVGAPAFGPMQPHGHADEDLLPLCRADDHDYKLAWSASRQAAHFNQPRFHQAAVDYLTRG